LIVEHIETIISSEAEVVGGTDLISLLAKSSATVAFDVLEAVKRLSPNAQSQGKLRKIEQWVGDCCESSEIPVNVIAEAIFAALDHDYPATASGKKKAESALGWAHKLIKKIQRDIPRAIFDQLADKIIATGSRVAANILRQISKGT
jgi:hypothetical protein